MGVYNETRRLLLYTYSDKESVMTTAKPSTTSTSIHPAFDWRRVAYLALLSRTLDELEEGELTPKGLVKYQFSARGHELGQVLLSQLLTHPHDGASVYYRSRPFMLGIGLDLIDALAAGMTKAGGLSDGRDVGVVFNMPSSGGITVLPNAADVGSQYTPGVGWAQAVRYYVDVLREESWDGAMAVIFGGDGSVAANGFWSALTIATTLQLPVLFVIEDNELAISVQGSLQTPGGNIARNLSSFTQLRVWDGRGYIPAETATLVFESVKHVRSGAGPGLLHLVVPRISGHSSVDNQAYKSSEDLRRDAQRDPIPALKNYLVPALMSPQEWEALQARARREVQAALEEALARPEPEASAITRHVWHDPAHPAQQGGPTPSGVTFPPGSETPQPPDPVRINMVEAIRRTLDAELAVNPRALIFGEDVGRKGGVHTATLGLQAKYGERRVFDTSLSEEGIVGRAVGMVIAGLTPIPEIQYRKYADPAMEQIHNCGTIRWRTANRFAAPVVIRMSGGYRKIGDPWHSVTEEIAYAHSVGWKVAVPSNAEDAVGLLRTALRGDDPVIFFEHRAMYDAPWARRPYPGDAYMIPFGLARIIQTGDALTVVTWGAMVERCELAAKTLDEAIEIIDLRTLQPWDKTSVLTSVRKTSKCLIVHEDIGFGGFGAEIAATIAEEAFEYLDGPIMRIAAPQVMTPYSQKLMEGVVPTVSRIRRGMERLLAY